MRQVMPDIAEAGLHPNSTLRDLRAALGSEDLVSRQMSDTPRRLKSSLCLLAPSTACAIGELEQLARCCGQPARLQGRPAFLM